LTLHILITGGAGFIGAHLARRLLGEGARIDLIDDFSRGRLDAELTALAEQPAVRCLERDLLAPGSLEDLGEDYDLVFHLAAIVGVANVMKQPLAVLRRNVELLLGMLDFAARQKRLRRLVFASTSEVHAGSLLHLDLPIPTPETAPVALPDLAQSRSSYLATTPDCQSPSSGPTTSMGRAWAWRTSSPSCSSGRSGRRTAAP
jgi:nucleoside-diphosphate-sugar epimerase